MAAWRSLHGGGSFGRVQGVVNWALDHFQEFDAWCLVKGINPIELPCYRFYNLIIYYLEEDRTDEQLVALQMDLTRLDIVTSPFERSVFDRGTGNRRVRVKTQATNPDKAVMAPKATMSPSQGDTPYMPKWWRGESTNFVVARSMMGSLPKAQGSESAK